MSRIPDCRSDEYYNQKYLSSADRREIFGFDWCAETVENFFANLEWLDENEKLLKFLEKEMPEEEQEENEWDYITLNGERETGKEKLVTYADYLRAALIEWIEMERDEVITSLIDSMTDEEYTKIKEQIDRGEAK